MERLKPRDSRSHWETVNGDAGSLNQKAGAEGPQLQEAAGCQANERRLLQRVRVSNPKVRLVLMLQ